MLHDRLQSSSSIAKSTLETLQANQYWQIILLNDELFSSSNEKYYKLVNRNSGKVLEVNASSIADGGAVVQRTYNGGTNQQWKIIPTSNGYSKIVNRNSGKVLEINGASTDNGSIADQRTDSGGTHQQWQIIEIQ
jgi:hypothetical protein